jgi:hypothetical protein
VDRGEEPTNAVGQQLAESSSGPAVRRGPGRPFVKGQSGNPGGRPKGLVSAIREQTRDGEELVTFMLRVFRGEADGARLRDRLEAATWLADRGFGKPTQAMELAGKDGEALLPLTLIQAIIADAEVSTPG